MCSTDRPEDYVVPCSYKPDETELWRIQQEQEGILQYQQVPGPTARPGEWPLSLCPCRAGFVPGRAGRRLVGEWILRRAGSGHKTTGGSKKGLLQPLNRPLVGQAMPAAVRCARCRAVL